MLDLSTSHHVKHVLHIDPCAVVRRNLGSRLAHVGYDGRPSISPADLTHAGMNGYTCVVLGDGVDYHPIIRQINTIRPDTHIVLHADEPAPREFAVIRFGRDSCLDEIARHVIDQAINHATAKHAGRYDLSRLLFDAPRYDHTSGLNEW